MKNFLLLMALFASLSAWAIEQDNDGYYLIGSVADWDEFAAIVHDSNPIANAKMVADIDLGNDQTMLGYYKPGESDINKAYKGVFDGQGYTLTVAYTDHGSNQLSTPIGSINGATIKNLHIAGYWISGLTHAAFVANSWGTSVIEKIWNSADITSDGMSWGETAAFVGCMKGGNLTIKDCHFSGTILGKQSFNGCFVGYIDSGTTNIINCLSTGTFTYYGSSNAFRGTHINCYVKQFPVAIPEAMQCTDEQLADGTIATALQAGREDIIWVQDTENSTPMLKIFMQQTSFLLGDVNDDDDVTISDVTALIDYLLIGDDSTINMDAADCNHDESVSISDVTALIDYLLSGTW